MALTHLLSDSFYDELFRHSIISCDGRIIANDDELKKYKMFLFQQSRDRTAKTFRERKVLVDKSQKLLRNRERSEIDNEKLETCLNKLGLHFKEDGTVSCKEFKQPPKRYVGPSFPEMSMHEREIAVHKINRKIQERDLKLLDDWLIRISDTRVRRTTKSRKEWKEVERKYRDKVESRLKGMAKSRQITVEKMNKEDLRKKWIETFKCVVENVKHSTMKIKLAAERGDGAFDTVFRSDTLSDKTKENISNKFRDLVNRVKGNTILLNDKEDTAFSDIKSQKYSTFKDSSEPNEKKERKDKVLSKEHIVDSRIETSIMEDGKQRQRDTVTTMNNYDNDSASECFEVSSEESRVSNCGENDASVSSVEQSHELARTSSNISCSTESPDEHEENNTSVSSPVHTLGEATESITSPRMQNQCENQQLTDTVLSSKEHIRDVRSRSSETSSAIDHQLAETNAVASSGEHNMDSETKSSESLSIQDEIENYQQRKAVSPSMEPSLASESDNTSDVADQLETHEQIGTIVSSQDDIHDPLPETSKISTGAQDQLDKHKQTDTLTSSKDRVIDSDSKSPESLSIEGEIDNHRQRNAVSPSMEHTPDLTPESDKTSDVEDQLETHEQSSAIVSSQDDICDSLSETSKISVNTQDQFDNESKESSFTNESRDDVTLDIAEGIARYKVSEKENFSNTPIEKVIPLTKVSSLTKVSEYELNDILSEDPQNFRSKSELEKKLEEKNLERDENEFENSTSLVQEENTSEANKGSSENNEADALEKKEK